MSFGYVSEVEPYVSKTITELLLKYKFNVTFCIKNTNAVFLSHTLDKVLLAHEQYDYCELITKTNMAMLFFNERSALDLFFKEHGSRFGLYHSVNNSKYAVVNGGFGGQYFLEYALDVPLEIDMSLYENINAELLTRQYFEHKAPLLILAGKPGCGKTSLIKHIGQSTKKMLVLTNTKQVNEHALNAILKLLWGEDSIIVIDDVFEDLGQREGFVENICQITSGLYSGLPKIIISTNKEIKSIDHALSRRGRCFDIVNIAYLSKEHASKLWKEKTGESRSFENEVSQAEFIDLLSDFRAGTNTRSYILMDASIPTKKIGFG